MELMVATPTNGDITQVELVEWPKAPETTIAESQNEIQSPDPRTADILPPLEVTSSGEIEEGGRSATRSRKASIQKCAPEEAISTAPNKSSIAPERHTDDVPTSEAIVHPETSHLTPCTESKHTTIPYSPTAGVQAVGPSKSRQLVKSVTTLSRLTSGKNQWPDPHLSIGAKCNRLGSNECWKATGPAEELFILISKSIGDILDARVDELEEGEPVAGHVLLFNLYMIGKSAATAQPTLLFTCKRPKPRRRAIKFIKESGILKNYPRITLAESAVPPLGMGSSYVRLLAGHTMEFNRERPYPLHTPASLVPRSTETSVPSSKLSTGAIAGIGLGGIVVVTVIVGLFFLFWRRKKYLKSGPPVSRSEAGMIDNRYSVKNWLSRTPADGKALTATTDNRPMMPYEYEGLPYSIPVGETEVHELIDTSRRIELPAYTGFIPIRTNNSEHNINKGGNVTSFHSATSYTASRASTISRGSQPTHMKIPEEINEHGPSNSSHKLIHGLYGLPIISSSTRSQSTIGGVLYSNGIFYGFTVCHVFKNFDLMPPQNEPTLDNRDYDSEFAFDEDSEDTTEIAAADVAVTSQASVSDADSTTSISRSISADSAILRPAPRKSLPIETALLYNESSGPAISLKVSSSQGMQFGLDWALVELSKNFVDTLRKPSLTSTEEAPPGIHLTVAHNIQSKLEKNVNVISITGYSGTLFGVLSPGFTPMKLSPRSKFQDVWTVIFDKPLRQGDSGSWVFNPITGDLYGHIVAGIPESRIAYIIPAFKIFEVIRQQIGPVQFASDVFAAETVEAGGNAKDKSVSGAV